MKDIREALTEKFAPTLQAVKVPDEERLSVWDLTRNLNNLLWLTNEFEAALSLFDYCREPREDRDDFMKYVAWSRIAARDGAMTIFHFGISLKIIRGFTLAACPTIRIMIDHSELRIAVKLFRSYFPDFEAVRHQVAHAVEINKDIKSIRQNAKRGTGVTIQNSLNDRTFVNTFEGQEISYEISSDTLAKLRSVREHFYKPFRALDLRSSRHRYRRDDNKDEK